METVQRRVFSQKKKTTFRNEGDCPVHTQSWGAMSGNLGGPPGGTPASDPGCQGSPGALVSPVTRQHKPHPQPTRLGPEGLIQTQPTQTPPPPSPPCQLSLHTGPLPCSLPPRTQPRPRCSEGAGATPAPSLPFSTIPVPPPQTWRPCGAPPAPTCSAGLALPRSQPHVATFPIYPLSTALGPLCPPSTPVTSLTRIALSLPTPCHRLQGL